MLGKFLKPGDGVLDIGGHTGDYARRYAQIVGPRGTVLSVEPTEASVREHRQRSGAMPWITVMQVAVSDTMGPRTLFLDREDARRNSLWAPNVVAPDGSVTVQTVTLDHLAGLVDRLAGIKIDAQGAEAAILAGGADTLAREGVTWAVELWPNGVRQAGADIETVIAAFESHGWQVHGRTWEEVRAECARQTSAHAAIDVVMHR